MRDTYPPIADYALLGDCHSAALVSRAGSIDWACLPRFDSASCFGRLLDWETGGYCQIKPTTPVAETTRAYVDDTLVLATTFRTAKGECVVYDCFTMRRGGAEKPRRQLLRIIEGTRGSVELHVHVEPRFDYGEVRAWLRKHGRRFYSALGAQYALVIAGDIDFDNEGEHALHATVSVSEGERIRLSIRTADAASIDPTPPDPPTAKDLDQRLQETIKWWRRWVGRGRFEGRDAEATKRSTIVLKALTNAPTGAVAAAPTTSLPEAIGAERNWDYRFSWIRDAHITVRSLAEVGFDAEADGFRRFVERTAAGSVDNLQIMYGVRGERRLQEFELPHLEGYRKSGPVRVGNAAANQTQLDVYGYLLELAWQWHLRGSAPDDDYWRFLLQLVDAAAERWAQPDSGIWELRGPPRHFTHSKAMCWVALDRGIRLAEDSLRSAPIKRWRKTRQQIRDEVEAHGWNDERKTYVQSYGSTAVDAAVLLLPSFDFIAYDDPRMVSTTDAIWKDLDEGDGLLRRYRSEDNLEGEEGVFVACTFWLVECLARQRRFDEARKVYERAMATANDLGLFAEEYAPRSGELLGNFPQGISHFSHIAAAVALCGEAGAVGS